MRAWKMAVLVSLMASSASATWAARITGPSGYSLDAAAGWKVKSTPGGLPELFVMGSPVAGFTPNLNVVVIKAPVGVTLDQIAAVTPKTLKSVSTNWKPLATGNTTLGGKRAAFLEYTAEMGTPKRVLWFRQVIVITAGKVCTFTCTALPGRRAASAKAFGAMMKSVRWE